MASVDIRESLKAISADGTTAVDRLDLDIVDGEFMVFVGPSGCGKTTALRMVAGLEDISGGVVRIGERAVNDLTPKSRDIAMVFQSYALYPHLTVRDNIAFPLKIAKVPKDEIRRRVAEAARILDLEPYLKRKPRALSGGQRQRVAMGRAIVRQPAVFLLDEPLSNLDAKLRVQMRADIKKIQHDLGTTTIYVTHDQVEAMTMGDRVAVMRKGELQQVAPPQELYDRPRNVFVAGFIGSPAMNMLEGRVERGDGGLVLVLGDSRLAVDAPQLGAYVDRTVVVGLRPENLEDAALVNGAAGGRLRGHVVLREALGAEVLVHFTIAARQAVTDDMRDLAEDVGDDRVVEKLAAGAAQDVTIVGRFSPHTKASQGDVVEVWVDLPALHFFDPGDRARDLLAACLVAHSPDERERRRVEALDVVADERLPSLVRRIVLEQAERGLQVVALDEVEELTAAAPNRPVADPSATVRLDQVLRDAYVGGVVRRPRSPAGGGSARRRPGSRGHRRVFAEQPFRLQLEPEIGCDRLAIQRGVPLDLRGGTRPEADAGHGWVGEWEGDRCCREASCRGVRRSPRSRAPVGRSPAARPRSCTARRRPAEPVRAGRC